MPKKTKPPKPIPSALTVASASQFPAAAAPKTQRPTIAASKPLSKPVNSTARKAARSVGASKSASVPRKTALQKSPTPPVATGPVAVTFVLTNAHAGRVLLSGDFNDWSADATPMTRQGDGRWETTIALQPGKHQYKFIVDGQWVPDPNVPERAADGYGDGNSVVEVRG